jgi:acylphosphatase
MKEILNKTGRPLRIALPRGKVLRVGPRMVAQVADSAVELKSILKLVEDGSIEIVGEGERPQSKNATGPGNEHTQGRVKSTHKRGSGER